MDFTQVITDFTTHARLRAPEEACGLVYLFKGRPRLCLVRNSAADPLNDFAIAPASYALAEAMGEVIGVIHSHPGQTGDPSLLDRSSHAASGLQWWIIGLLDDGTVDVCHMPAVGQMQLTGRSFVHGVTDCYTLIRDWYRQERGIDLPDFERADDWWLKGLDLYIAGFPQAGFTAVDEAPAAGDVLLMNIGASVCNHAAVFIGGDKILHHLHGRLSSYDLYSGFYRDRTRHVLRYTGGPALG